MTNDIEGFLPSTTGSRHSVTRLPGTGAQRQDRVNSVCMYTTAFNILQMLTQKDDNAKLIWVKDKMKIHFF